jgi:hypothetical protein
VLANGSMSSAQSGEDVIRRRIVDEDVVDCMVALPGQLFYSTQIPACLWFLARNKNPGGELRDRRGAPGKTDPDYVAEPTGDETDSGNADAETFAARPANSIRIDAVTWTAWNHQLTPVQAAAVRNGVLEKLRDPQSAVFSKAGALVSSRGLVLICGYVNAKNGFGGYAGMTLYSAELIGERVGVVDVDLGPVDVCRMVRF